MNCKQANTTIVLEDLMGHLGYKIMKREGGGSELRYLSPFRNETTPSFYINTRKNCWYDQGSGEGSFKVVDFAIQYLRSIGRASTVSDALNWLESMVGSNITKQNISFSFSQQNVDPEQDDNPSLELHRVLPLKSKALLAYLSQIRKIPEHIAQRYLQLVQYHNHAKPRKDGKPYFAIGCKTLSGWELRSCSDQNVFKSHIGKKSISVITGTGSRGVVNVFEGFIDALSYLVIMERDDFSHDALILNGLELKDQAIDYINTHEYDLIRTWLDNHTPADNASDYLKEGITAHLVTYSHLFEEKQDLNDVLKTGQGGQLKVALQSSQEHSGGIPRHFRHS